MHDQSLNVIQLQVYLPGQHIVIFDPEEDPIIVHECATTECTTLTAWFTANADMGVVGDLVRQFTYQEFPQYFTWKDATKKWEIWKQGFTIG